MLKDAVAYRFCEDKDMGDPEDRVSYPTDNVKVLTMYVQHWNLASFTLF